MPHQKNCSKNDIFSYNHNAIIILIPSISSDFSNCLKNGFIFQTFKKNKFILLLAALGLRYCAGFLQLGRAEATLCCTARASLVAVASLVAEHGLQARGLQQLWHAGSVVVAHGLCCSTACGIFPDQGSNLCPLHWQADS